MNRPTILVVDDDLLWAQLMAAELETAGFTAFAADSLKQARGVDGNIDLLISDWLLPSEESAVVLLRELRERNPLMKAVLISGLPKEDIVDELQGEKADAILEKPVDVDEVLAIARKVLGTPAAAAS